MSAAVRGAPEGSLLSNVLMLAAWQGILPAETLTVNPGVKPYLDLFPLLPNGRDFGDGRAEYARWDTQVPLGKRVFDPSLWYLPNLNIPGPGQLGVSGPGDPDGARNRPKLRKD